MLSQRAEEGGEALPMFWERSGGPSGKLGWVSRTRRGRKSLPEGWVVPVVSSGGA